MNRICLCLQFLNPRVSRNYRFSIIYLNQNYTDKTRQRLFTKKPANEKLTPFPQKVKVLSGLSPGKFMAEVSVSGLALQLLSEYTLNILWQITELLKSNTLGFLSETWSHTLQELTDNNSLQEQMLLHDGAMEEVIDVKYSIFIAHSPLRYRLIPVVYTPGKRWIFLYSNFFFRRSNCYRV